MAAVIFPYGLLRQHAARMRELVNETPEERAARNVLPADQARELDRVSIHYAFHLGPRLFAGLVGVVSTSRV